MVLGAESSPVWYVPSLLCRAARANIRSRFLQEQKHFFFPKSDFSKAEIRSVKRIGKFTDLLLLFLPRQNHHLPPFLGIFSFMIFSTAAWGREQNRAQKTQHNTVKNAEKLNPYKTLNQQKNMSEGKWPSE